MINDGKCCNYHYLQPFIGDITADVHVCVGRNVHERKLGEIEQLHKGWENTPPTMNKIDLRQIIQDSSIQEVSKYPDSLEFIKREHRSFISDLDTISNNFYKSSLEIITVTEEKLLV